MIFGDLVGLKLPDIFLTGEENPEKTSPRKLLRTGDETQARCITGAQGTACSTAVDTINKLLGCNIFIENFRMFYFKIE